MVLGLLSYCAVRLDTWSQWPQLSDVLKYDVLVGRSGTFPDPRLGSFLQALSRTELRREHEVTVRGIVILQTG